MNAPVTFNTLSFVRRMNEVVFETTATKTDVKDSEAKVTASVRELQLKVAADIKMIKLKIAEPENRVTVRVGGMLAGSTALVVAILGALITFK